METSHRALILVFLVSKTLAASINTSPEVKGSTDKTTGTAILEQSTLLPTALPLQVTSEGSSDSAPITDTTEGSVTALQTGSSVGLATVGSTGSVTIVGSTVAPKKSDGEVTTPRPKGKLPQHGKDKHKAFRNPSLRQGVASANILNSGAHGKEHVTESTQPPMGTGSTEDYTAATNDEQPEQEDQFPKRLIRCLHSFVGNKANGSEDCETYEEVFDLIAKGFLDSLKNDNSSDEMEVQEGHELRKDNSSNANYERLLYILSLLLNDPFEVGNENNTSDNLSATEIRIEFLALLDNFFHSVLKHLPSNSRH